MMSQYGLVFDKDGRQAGPEITSQVTAEAIQRGWSKHSNDKSPDSRLVWVPPVKSQIQKGDTVIKSSGDYSFTGTVVAVFEKLSGKVRVVVENQDGILHIFSETQLVKPAQ